MNGRSGCIEDYLIHDVQENDLPQILQLQKLAYLSEAGIYDNLELPPLVQTLDELRLEWQNQLILKAECDGRIIGSVRAVCRGTACHIGKLMVDPGYQNRGLGSRLLVEVESRFPGAVRFELFTGDRSVKNLTLYGKLGYSEFKREPVPGGYSLIYLEKLDG